MTVTRLLVTTIFVVFTALTFNLQALACTCMARPTLLDAFESANLVVTARLASVEKVREKEGKYDVDYIRSATMIVDKVYKGNVKPGATLKFGQGGGADCIWTFDEEWIGQQFLFYVGSPTKGPAFGEGMASATVWPKEGGESMEPMYHAITCGRSNSLKSAQDDLAYLDNIAKLKGRTRLSGTFDTWSAGDFNPADIKIKIIGKSRTFTAKTNKDGFFELYDLPPGDYVAQIDLPFGWKINDYMVGQTSTGYDGLYPAGQRKIANQIPVRITAGRHAELDLIFDIDTAIKGQVLSPAGKPMKDVCVMAVSTELAEGDHRGQSDCTNEKGEFIIDEMAPGNYRLLANYDGQMDDDAPFGVVFYPGVTDKAQAGIIAVEAGRHVTKQIIHIPQTVELVSFKGKFLYSDGKPVVDEWVRFVPDDSKHYDDMNEKTDATGSFTFRVPKGATGKVSGEMSTYSGKFRNCPKLEELIKATGSTWYTAKTTVAEINSLEPRGLIEIKLPFPYCVKAKQ